MGQVIASSCVSAVDDGTLKSEWGSQTMDDEGFPTQRNLLIENGQYSEAEQMLRELQREQRFSSAFNKECINTL